MSSDLDSATTMQIETKPRARGRPRKYESKEALLEARRAQSRARNQRKAELEAAKYQSDQSDNKVRCNKCFFECDFADAAEKFGFRTKYGSPTNEPFKACVACREKKRKTHRWLADMPPEKLAEYNKSRRSKQREWYHKHKNDLSMTKLKRKNTSLKLVQTMNSVLNMIDLNNSKVSVNEIREIIASALSGRELPRFKDKIIENV